MYGTPPPLGGGPAGLSLLPRCSEACAAVLGDEIAALANKSALALAQTAKPSKQGQQHVGSACNRCGRVSGDPKVDFKRCGRCKKAHYCSERCQKEDWAQHKIFCGKIF
ncbi:hypothetical protein DFJ74DRAFT_710839 [Hyaloraphidium curvatum]|nr:hypothetical protein DFJ74DRAFT_710839 [Hyaloraphidium curvatum]